MLVLDSDTAEDEAKVHILLDVSVVGNGSEVGTYQMCKARLKNQLN